MELSKPAWGIIWRARIFLRLSEMGATGARHIASGKRASGLRAKRAARRRAASGSVVVAPNISRHTLRARAARGACFAQLPFLALFELPGHSEHVRENLTQSPATPAPWAQPRAPAAPSAIFLLPLATDGLN